MTAAAAPASAGPLLRVRDLRVRYARSRDEHPAVDGVDLDLDAGQTLGLAGESGCGKSTVAMSVLRLLPRTAEVTGRIELGGEDVTTMSWGRLRAVRWAEASVVFQGAMHAFNPVRRVGGQIAEPMRLHGVEGSAGVDAAVAELLDQVELPARAARAYPHELSGGPKQRAMIAKALACSPSQVIADEPTTALDVVVQAQVLGLLTRLVAERGIGLVVISHDLSVLAATCDRLAVMRRGKVVEQGPTRQVIAAPVHEHSRALAAAFPTVGDPAFRRVREHGEPGEPLLSARDLRVVFDGVAAVDGVDLDVRPGEIVALVGQSGSGKTTLARTLLGLQRPTSGHVEFDGAPLPRSTAGLRAFRRQAQLVLQDPTSALNPRHSVYEAVAEGLRIHRVDGDEAALVAAALEQAELRPPVAFTQALPHELSGGQRQRVVIAGALALGPRVLVADEPVASLDASVRGEILALLLRLRADLGLGALVITHDLGLAWTIADRVVVMLDGRFVEQGPVEEVLLRPRHEYTKALLEAVWPLDSRRRAGRGGPGTVGRTDA
ncbi:ATP-binding cassette domain-containing protein [Actinosynnema sp.]|uniref:ATP-binding cassette domain-containing protein n=1 Tax=Actinosynnema sp. TaxID=1872144 RepID=UPI003F824585